MNQTSKQQINTNGAPVAGGQHVTLMMNLLLYQTIQNKVLYTQPKCRVSLEKKHSTHAQRHT